MTTLLPLPQELRQPLPIIIGNADYREFEHTLMRISDLIVLSGMDKQAMQYAVNNAERNAQDNYNGPGEFPGLDYYQQIHIQRKADLTIRLMIIKELRGFTFRSLSCALAESQLLQCFCKIDRFDGIKVPSKSAIERYEKMFSEDQLEEMITKLIIAASTPADDETNQELLLEKEINLIDYYLDTTCIKANIHFPVDWILLRDATRTLMKAVMLIRKHGLKNRMDDPAVFIKEMNKLCIKMTHARNHKKSKKMRKKIFRLMKNLMKIIENHAEKHKNLLRLYRDQTDLSEKQALRIIERINSVLAKLPQAIHQANERIIAGNLVKNEEKILSLYEDDINVLVRKKSGAFVEFGNKLLLGEQEDGIIIDWHLYPEGAPSDTQLLSDSIDRIKQRYDSTKPESVTTDRGFDSKVNREFLEDYEIQNYMCPRSVTELKVKLQDDEFVNHQTRRGQTEARIGILKNKFLGKPLRSKGFENRSIAVAWAVFAHNLWVISRLPAITEIKKELAA